MESKITVKPAVAEALRRLPACGRQCAGASTSGPLAVLSVGPDLAGYEFFFNASRLVAKHLGFFVGRNPART